MTSPTALVNRYRNLKVPVAIEDSATQMSRAGHRAIALRKYFMMNWTDGTEERRDYNAVTRGSNSDLWFRSNKDKIRNAAMGKGAPGDYELAMEWAVRAGKVANTNQATLQTFCDNHLGIDCSGFVTNYLIAAGKKAYSNHTVRNTGAASYYSAQKAINDVSQIRSGDILVWMRGNAVLRGPGHVAVIESFSPVSRAGGNMRVVEATGSSRANPKLLDSMYTVEEIISRGGNVPVMILVVKRLGRSGARVAVMRW